MVEGNRASFALLYAHSGAVPHGITPHRTARPLYESSLFLSCRHFLVQRHTSSSSPSASPSFMGAAPRARAAHRLFGHFHENDSLGPPSPRPPAPASFLLPRWSFVRPFVPPKVAVAGDKTKRGNGLTASPSPLSVCHFRSRKARARGLIEKGRHFLSCRPMDRVRLHGRVNSEQLATCLPACLPPFLPSALPTTNEVSADQRSEINKWEVKWGDALCT